MNTKKVILILTSTIALASFGYWFYERKRVQALNQQIDTLESAQNKLMNI